MAPSFGLLLNAAFFHRPAKGRLLRSWLQANCHRLLQTLAMLCLLWAFHAPASANTCTINVPATANSPTTYVFTTPNQDNCDPQYFGIAYDSLGNSNQYSNSYSTPTSNGGQLYIYNDILSDGSFRNGFKYTPAPNFVGNDTGTFFTVDPSLTSWHPNGTVIFNVAAPPPTVTSLSKTTGIAGTEVIISGTNFLGVTQVSFGASSASTYTVNTPTSITVTVPAGVPGATVAVTVTNSSGTSATSPADKFTYQGTPVLSGVAPSSGSTAGATSVTLTGTNLLGTSAVTFGGAAATDLTINSSASVTVSTPAHAAGIVNVVLTTPGGTATLTNGFTYIAPPPTLTSVSPNSGSTAGGTSVTLTGSNLLGTSAVSFGGTAATAFTVNNATTITATTPAHAAGIVNVVLTTPGGTATLTNGYTYALPAPTAGSVSATVAANSSSNPITLNLGGGAATSIAISTTAAHGTATVSGTNITYTPTAGYSGSDSFTYTATNASGTSSPATVTITVSAPTLAISPTTLPNATASNIYSQTLSSANGGDTYTYSLSAGGLPPGITFASNGQFSGTPSTTGTYNFTIGVHDEYGASGSRAYSLTVNAASIIISPATLGPLPVGSPYSQALGATGGNGSYTWTLGGTLPTGLTLASSGLLSGTPSAAGTYNFTVTATDSLNSAGSRAYSVSVNDQAPVASNSNLSVQGGSINNPVTLNLSGGAVTQVTITTNASNGTATATGSSVRYTPNPGFAGSDSFSFSATGPGGTSSVATVSVTVSLPTVTITPASLTNPTQNTAYSQTLTASGGSAPYTFSVVVGSLPTGMSLAPTGLLSGTPTAAGPAAFTIRATDNGGFFGERSYAVVVASQTPVAGPVSATLAANSSANPITLNLSGGAATSVAISTAAAHGTATASGTTISYTPTAGFSGSDSFTYTATGVGGTSPAATVNITVLPPTLAITPATASLPAASHNTTYTQTLNASGGISPYSYAVTSGALPAGLSLDAGGAITGTPTAVVTSNFTVTVTDANGATGSRAYSLQVQAQAVVVPPSSESVVPGQTATVDLTRGATGGPFTSAALLSVSPPSAGTARMIGPFTMSFAPAAAFSGSAVVSFNLQAASGSVGNGFVTFAVQSRPDPTTDATVRGVTTSQQQAAVRFAGTQLMNFTQRLEHLRNPQRSTFTNGLQLAMPRAVNTQVRNCRSATSLLEQQECVSSQGRMERGSLAPGWSRAAQHNAAAAAQGMNTEQAFASRPQPLGQDVPLSEVGSASGTQRSVTASQQFMGKIAPEHAQMTALPAADTPIAEPGSAARPRLAYWTSGMVDWGFADATAGQDDGLRFTTSGVTMGMDYLLSKEWTVGMGIGFAYDRTKIGSEGSRNHSKGVSTALYGSWNPAPAYFVDGVLGYSRMSFDTRRWVADAGEFAQGERDGSQWFAALSAGYEWRTEQWMLSPYGRLQFARSSLDAYTETGAGWHALRFEKQSITNTSASLGLRGEISHDTRWGTLLPFGRLELQHDFDHQSNMRLGYADLAGSSQSYSISSTALGRNRVQLGFGSRLQSRVGTFAAEMQFTRSSHSFQRGLRLTYITRW